MPAAIFETTISARERPQAYALNRVATVIGRYRKHAKKYP
jgi:hypothetical protein